MRCAGSLRNRSSDEVRHATEIAFIARLHRTIAFECGRNGHCAWCFVERACDRGPASDMSLAM
ncbi:hypothetical protein WS77_31425 [Burkholderia sp. MSMB0265]|nr:hypothetical protein WS77_31425 [Burkholderia sp. MSMB0265]